jgi:hypothetical protein
MLPFLLADMSTIGARSDAIAALVGKFPTRITLDFVRRELHGARSRSDSFFWSAVDYESPRPRSTEASPLANTQRQRPPLVHFRRSTPPISARKAPRRLRGQLWMRDVHIHLTSLCPGVFSREAKDHWISSSRGSSSCETVSASSIRGQPERISADSLASSR